MVHVWFRTETKPGEARAALTPDDCVWLQENGVKVTVEKSSQRMIQNEDYEKKGLVLVEEGSWKNAPSDAVIVGIKELPDEMKVFRHHHVFFAHCFKNQDGWKDLMKRFIDGQGCILDVEFMVNDDGKRIVNAMSPMAGYCGMALGVHAWCHQQLTPTVKYPEVPIYSDENKLIDEIKEKLRDLAKLHTPEKVMPKVIIIGALGMCGKGAIKMAEKIGLEKSDLTLWDLDETKRGGPFQEILDHDIFVNCVYLPVSGPPIPPFITKSMLEDKRRLTMIVDVSCDPNSDNNPVRIYDAITTMKEPLRKIQVENSKHPIDVMAIDHLPSVLPKESSEQFSRLLAPCLKNLDNPDDPVWKRCRDLFEAKSKEV